MTNENEKEKLKRGRPRWMPSDSELKQVEGLAAQGLSQEQIAAALGIAFSTLKLRKKDYSAFSATLEKGRAKGIATIANALFQDAKNGNTTAQIFYLKTRAGWRETQVTEITGKDGKPIEVLNYAKSKLLAKLTKIAPSDADTSGD